MRVTKVEGYLAVIGAVLISTVGFTSRVQAELPPSAYAEMRENAPELLFVKVEKVQETDRDESTTNYAIEASVHYVERSQAQYSPGDRVNFESYYVSPAAFRNGFVGPRSPPKLYPGWTGWVYLDRSMGGQGLGPAAYGQSFHPQRLPAQAANRRQATANSNSLRAEQMAEVIDSRANVMDRNRVLATFARGTRVWVFSLQNGWAEVKIPDSEEHGWVKVSALRQVNSDQQSDARLSQAEALSANALDEAIDFLNAAIKAKNKTKPISD